jgi:malonyl-CoA decarboxylase
MYHSHLFPALADVNKMSFIVNLRADLLNINRSEKSKSTTETSNKIINNNNDDLKQLDVDMKSLLSSVFSSGSLELRRITYDHTPASIIEKITRKESVHPVQNLVDLKSRLGSGRRCFAFFHPMLPATPLIFVNVALLTKIATGMHDIESAPSSESESNTAIFYSINATEKGLGGVDLGSSLIKQVASKLKAESEGSIDTYSTLSPIPGFSNWLKLKMSGKESEQNYVFASGEEEIEANGFTNAQKEALNVIAANEKWYEDEGIEAAVKPHLLK